MFVLTNEQTSGRENTGNIINDTKMHRLWIFIVVFYRLTQEYNYF